MNQLAEKISGSELEIMQVLWEADGPLSISEIRKTMQQRSTWEPTTIKTLVQRLCSKGAVKQEKHGVFYYSPLVSRSEYKEWATGDLIRRVYHGSAKALVAALVHSEGLSKEDVDELRHILDKEEKEK